MSSESIKSEIDALQAQLACVERDSDALAMAMATSRTLRRCLLLFVVALICVITYSFYSLGAEIKSEKNLEKMAELSRQKLERNSKLYMDEFHTLVHNTTPTLSAAFLAQAKEDSGKFLAAMEKERDGFVEDLGEQLEQRLAAQHEKTHERFNAILQKEFKISEDKEAQDRLMRNVERALEKIVKEHYVEGLKAQLEQMYVTWDEFPVADNARPGDPSLKDQLYGYLLELLTVKLSGSQKTQES